MTRRDLLISSIAAMGAGSASGETAAHLPPGARVPKFELVYESDVTLAETLDVGNTVDGHRRIIPITGGTFSGSRLRGHVLPIGADWNLARNDGSSSVEAAYYLRTDDDVTIRIFNKGVGAVPASSPRPDEERFIMFTHPQFEAPQGKYDWMNRSTFIGTLGMRPNARNTVLIRVFEVV